MVHSPKNIYYLALYRNNLPSSSLKQSPNLIFVCLFSVAIPITIFFFYQVKFRQETNYIGYFSKEERVNIKNY